MADLRLRSLKLTVGKRTGTERRWPCTISTEAGVVRRDRDGDEYLEILDHAPESIDFSRGPLPLLEAHDTEKVNIGVVENLRLEGRTLKGDLVLGASARAAELAPDIDAGIVTGLSVGYMQLETKRERQASGPPVVRVVRWQPYEVSLTGVPLDISAGIGRAKGKHMSASTQTRAEGGASEAAPATGTTATVATTVTKEREMDCSEIDPETDPELYEEMGCGEQGGEPEGEQEGRAIRSGDCGCKDGKGKRTGKPGAARVLTPAELRAAERKRIATITRNVEVAGLDRSLAEDLVNRDLTVEAAGRMIFMALSKRDKDTHGNRRTVGQVEAGADPRDHFRSGVTNALGDRIGVAKLDDNGRRLRSLHTIELCKAALVDAGASRAVVDLMSREQIALAALGNRELMGRAGMHSTSTLPSVFGDLAGKNLRNAYQAAPETYSPIVRKVTLPDFKDRKILQFSEGPSLLEVKEGGEYFRGTVTETKVTWALLKYGRIFAVTWEAMLADDLDAISRIPAMFGQAAANLRSDLVWAQITGNPTMAYDSVALFHSTHGNLETGGGSALANSTIATARKNIRKQKGLDGVTFLNLNGKFLIVPAALEFTAMTLLAPVAAAQASNVNLYAGQFQLIVEPRLDANSATAWYLACDPGQIDVIEVGTLDGEGDGPTTTTRDAFDSDGMEIKARLVFGAKVIEHRGLHKSAGA
jgi:phage head maturation protease